MIDKESDVWSMICGLSFRVVIVICVLEPFEDEARIPCVQVMSQPGSDSQLYRRNCCDCDRSALRQHRGGDHVILVPQRFLDHEPDLGIHRRQHFYRDVAMTAGDVLH